MERHRDLVFAMTSVSSLDGDPEISRVIDDLREASVDQMLVNHFGAAEAPAPIRFVLRGYTGLAQVAVGDWLVTERASREEVRVLMTEGLLALLAHALPKVVEASGIEIPGAPARKRDQGDEAPAGQRAAARPTSG